MKDVLCPECYDLEIILWRDQPMNEAIKEHVQSYVTPVKMFHLTFDDALWEGQEIK